MKQAKFLFAAMILIFCAALVGCFHKSKDSCCLFSEHHAELAEKWRFAEKVVGR